MPLVGGHQRWGCLLVIITILITLITPVVMVKHENFKTCEQSGFCKRNRALADEASSQGSSWQAPYALDAKSLKLNKGQLVGTIQKTISAGAPPVNLPVKISFLQSGSVRVTVDEEVRMKGEIELRHNSPARKERYNEADRWAIVGGLELDSSVTSSTTGDDTVVTFGPGGAYKAIIHHAPFGIDFVRDEHTHVKLNAQGLFNMEHWRAKVEKKTPEPAVEGQEAAELAAPVEPESTVDESTWWEESFGGNQDSKPRGPESVGLDITFPGYGHVYGIPEHAGPLSLKETRGGSNGYDQPYRLYNSDVFEYEMDSPMTLYGAIPFMHAHRKGSTVGVFWLNAAETWVDIVKHKTSSNPLNLALGTSPIDTQTHWFSESGLLDLFVFMGPTPQDVIQSYSSLTGYTQLPQQFAIAYHQCRWNYVTDEDVKDVDRKMDKNNIPYDVIWLDIEYTDGKKYFTWDDDSFPDPTGMGKHLDAHDRKLVVIIDPHIKNEGNYPVVDAMKEKGLAVKNKDGNIYDGWCWPGSSHWIDAFNPAAITWWRSLFTYSSFKGTLANTFIWNDMNEPSVFNGPETTMPKDNLHHGSWEHRDVHNLNGMTFINATYDALLHRDSPSKRPFVLTRSFFSGSQRMGAMWTGDNLADWSHLKASLPMILAQNIAGFPFSGADVGGFFGNPSKELLTRWYQAGAFYPFFRGHAHIDTRRREPYLVGDPYTGIITQALRLRYSLLPAWYTAFHTASINNAPIVRPMWWEHPDEEAAFGIDDQMYIADTGLLIKPITEEGTNSVDIYIPDNEVYYDYYDYTTVAKSGRKTYRFDAPLESNKIPLLMRGGHIIPRKDRPRRSSGLMKYDPYTLVVVLDNAGNAQGEVYVDDGESYDYQQGAYIHRTLRFEGGARAELVSVAHESSKAGKQTKKFLQEMSGVRVEKVIIVGVPKSWGWREEVLVQEDGAKEGRKVGIKIVRRDGGKADWAVVRNPGVGIGVGWKILFE
ncbi:hypothetical protein MMC25_006236 [Agyrium rufum]|nr:hypothetical protein [Agyrium rufum]